MVEFSINIMEERMKKHRLFITAALCMLCLAAALAAASPDRVEAAKSLLTEVCGYSPDEAQAFDFSDDQQGTLRFWPRAHPDWVYTVAYDENGMDGTRSTTPFFQLERNDYPGEASMRGLLHTAFQKGWFSAWDQAAMDAMAQALKADGLIRPSLGLQAGLATATISAAQAVDEFFVSCLGRVQTWTPAARQWRDQVLAQAGLSAQARYQLPLDTPVRVTLSGDPAQFTRFAISVPQALQPLLSHPRLAGASCQSGMVMEHQIAGSDAGGWGLACFSQGPQRLLAMFVREKDGPWQLFPVSEKALHPTRQPLVSHHDSTSWLQVEYEVDSSRSDIFIVYPQKLTGGLYVCALASYLQVDYRSGQSLQANSTPQGWDLTQTDSKGDILFDRLDLNVFGYMDAISDFAAWPTTWQEWLSHKKSALPPEVAMLQGVHLRRETSPHSEDLGLFNPGTLVKVLGQKTGSPFDWLQAQVGLKSGYVSTAYVAQPQSPQGHPVSYISPLPVAKAKNALALKRGPGLFDGTVQQLAAGAKMHVLGEHYGWLYVVVPQKEIGWLMDVDGAYGYVRPQDVAIAPTALQADWLP